MSTEENFHCRPDSDQPTPLTSPTPRTDAKDTFLAGDDLAEAYGELLDFSRQLERELAEARKENENLNASIASIEELHATPGKLEVHIKQHPAMRAAIAKSFAYMVADAPNYTEMKFDMRGSDQWITVTVQKDTGKTPHQKRQEAEAERDQLRAELFRAHADAAQSQNNARRADDWLNEAKRLHGENDTLRAELQRAKEINESVHMERKLQVERANHAETALTAAKSVLWMAEQYADGHAIAETGAEQRELAAAMEIING